MAADGGDDIAFGDDLHLRAQGRGGAQGSPQQRLGGIAAIDIGLVKAGDALGQAGLDLGLHMRGRSIGIIAKPPHAVNQPRQLDRA